MKSSPVAFEDLTSSVVAVPPLARNDDFTLDRGANAKLIRHLEGGGITSLLYGGNANFYNIALSEYAATLAFLAETAAPDSWVIPSVGPDYGKMMDQAALLRDMDFPTVMVLPLSLPATPEGVETGIRHFTERFAKPVICYLKSETYLEPEAVARLIDDGLVCAVKYAIVCEDPRQDDYLRRLLDLVDARLVVSGIGERPAIVHMREFGLPSFTSGSVCVAPRLSTRILEALHAEDYVTAEAIREYFLPLEDLRDAINPIRVLHAAVTLAGIANMGPVLPLLSDIEAGDQARVRRAAVALSAEDGRVGEKAVA